MQLLIVTGLSGAGKTQATNALEDIGYFCVDNVPCAMIPKFSELAAQTNRYSNIAVVTDIRTGDLFDSFRNCLNTLKENGTDYHILFLSASREVLAHRYSENRRRHPLLSDTYSLADAIDKEIERMTPISELADYRIDTSLLSTAQLKAQIVKLFSGDGSSSLRITCMSFGFKNGVPPESDLVFDVRCFANPFYIPELREKTGLDSEVREYVLKSAEAQEFYARLEVLLDYLIPLYVREGKAQLTISFGCTGGHHRSVVFCEKYCEHVKELGYDVRALHRDI